MTRGKKIDVRLGDKSVQAIIDDKSMYLWLKKESKIQKRTVSNYIRFILTDYYVRHDYNEKKFKLGV
jgi:hypothetical protein